MDFPLSISIDEFGQRLLKLLQGLSEPISEYDLIQQLREQSLFDIAAGDLLSSDSLIMFRIHFTTYHALYLLRDRLRNQQQNDLELSPIGIRLTDYRQGELGLAEHDPLYDYYMDLSNLEQTQTEDVDEMLQRFWLRLDNSERRYEALKELQLEDPVDNDEIRRQYRRLAMKHHPDRGGDKERLQRINAAVSILLNSYSL